MIHGDNGIKMAGSRPPEDRVRRKGALDLAAFFNSRIHRRSDHLYFFSSEE
jgi:hypothetical protein